MLPSRVQILLITPPFTQINTPYPATAYLYGFLKSKGHRVAQADLSLLVARRIFSAEGIKRIFAEAKRRGPPKEKNSREVFEFFLSAEDDYVSAIDWVVKFLCGNDDSLALKISLRKWLPEGPRFLPISEHQGPLETFGKLGLRDKARYLASLMIDDLADFIRFTIDADFELSKYGERLASSQISFDLLWQRCQPNESTLIDAFIEEEVRKLAELHRPDLVAMTCPFPGNVLGALKASQFFKKIKPKTKIVLGGGYVNTELREIEDSRFFDFIDYLILDDGERPLELLIDHLAGKIPLQQGLRTLWCEKKKLIVRSQDIDKDIPFKDLPGPSYEGLELKDYIPMIEMPNPMNRLWSDFRWNKLILAHGCYWRECTFCDTSLDYIERFEPARVEKLVESMVRLAQETKTQGFHFVDEAAPPALLKTLSKKLVEKNLNFTWWGNIRFDKQFTQSVTDTMAEAGCVAVTGGIEVASPRLLQLINKGVTLEQVARVTKAFSNSGILVHAYLMYGFPSQTLQETVDSLEIVRQLFKQGCLQSAHWHRFVTTYHSPIGQNPTAFGIQLLPPNRPKSGWFARNAVDFKDSVICDHDQLGVGLRKAIYNYMHGIGIDEDVRFWFDFKVPRSKVKKSFIRQVLGASF